MGVVYEAEQEALGRRVALKVLPKTPAGDGKALIRFQREAKAAARMHHTNIVPVFDVGQDGEHVFYAMQLIHGQGLDLVIDDLKRLRDQRANPAPSPLPLSPEGERGANLPLAPASGERGANLPLPPAGERGRGEGADGAANHAAQKSIAASLLHGQFEQEN